MSFLWKIKNPMEKCFTWYVSAIWKRTHSQWNIPCIYHIYIIHIPCIWYVFRYVPINSGGRLRAQGFGELWQRRYLELPEFYGYVGSFSEFHYGVRFPLIFPEVPEIAEPQNKDPLESSRVQNDLVHLRGHMYLARRCMQDPLGRRNFVKQTPEDSPTNIFSCPSRLGMEALTQFLAPEFDV